jgi:L-ascorbate metabolism protein UlaG (beta-lactamase superfamily)
MSTRLTFLGVAGYDIAGPSFRVLIDPFLSEATNPPVSPDELETPDVILVSHAAPDHLGDAAAIAKRTGAPVVCDGGVKRILIDRGVPADSIRATVWGIPVEVGGVVVRPIECHHWSAGELSDGTPIVGTPLAFLVETEPGVRIYHYGDTCVFDMSLIGELYKPTVGLLGCTVPYELTKFAPGPGRLLGGEMNADEAARVAEMLGLELAVACHYSEPDDAVARFLELVGHYDTSGSRRAVAPTVGQTLVVEPGGAYTVE